MPASFWLQSRLFFGRVMPARAVCCWNLSLKSRALYRPGFNSRCRFPIDRLTMPGNRMKWEAGSNSQLLRLAGEVLPPSRFIGRQRFCAVGSEKTESTCFFQVQPADSPPATQAGSGQLNRSNTPKSCPSRASGLRSPSQPWVMVWYTFLKSVVWARLSPAPSSVRLGKAP